MGAKREEKRVSGRKWLVSSGSSLGARGGIRLGGPGARGQHLRAADEPRAGHGHELDVQDDGGQIQRHPGELDHRGADLGAGAGHRGRQRPRPLERSGGENGAVVEKTKTENHYRRKQRSRRGEFLRLLRLLLSNRELRNPKEIRRSKSEIGKLPLPPQGPDETATFLKIPNLVGRGSCRALIFPPGVGEFEWGPAEAPPSSFNRKTGNDQRPKMRTPKTTASHTPNLGCRSKKPPNLAPKPADPPAPSSRKSSSRVVIAGPRRYLPRQEDGDRKMKMGWPCLHLQSFGKCSCPHFPVNGWILADDREDGPGTSSEFRVRSSVFRVPGSV